MYSSDRVQHFLTAIVPRRLWLISLRTLLVAFVCIVFYNFYFTSYSDQRPLLLPQESSELGLVLPETSDDDEPPPTTGRSNSSKVKSILLWNDNPDRVEIVTFGSGIEAFTVCRLPREEQCELVLNRTQRLIESYDAIVVNAPVIQWSERGAETLPLLFDSRKPNQRLVFFSQESPVHTWGRTVNPNNFKGHFNWTMTYRFDSDIPLSYGRLIRRLQSEEEEIQSAAAAVVAGKTKMVAWMVSHCLTDSRRGDYVNELKLHLPVDIYGDCGTLKCPRSWDFTSSDCYDMVESKYKFYLSFENAICRDYVTEKFFEALGRNIVPIVYGGIDYNHIAPPHSFIDARQYKPKELAEYLKLLDTNDTLYAEYFEWKKDFVVVEAGLPQMGRNGFCDLCRKLHREEEAKTITDIGSYWGLDTCHHPKEKWWNDQTAQSIPLP